MQVITAVEARNLFPNVVGEIRSATLASGYAVLDMGPSAYGVMVGGKFIACCPTREAAHEAGRTAPKPWDKRRKIMHFTRQIGAGVTPYPICSAGYGKGGRRRKQNFTAIIENVTCKTCRKMLGAA